MKAPRRDILTSWFYLCAVDLAIASGGFRRVHDLVSGIRVRRHAASRREGAIEAVNDAVNRAAIWYPRHVHCLPRSVVVTWMLRRRGVAAVMVIGVRKMPFYAHAWVEVGGLVVNDLPKVQTLYPVLDRIAPPEAAR